MWVREQNIQRMKRGTHVTSSYFESHFGNLERVIQQPKIRDTG